MTQSERTDRLMLAAILIIAWGLILYGLSQ